MYISHYFRTFFFFVFRRGTHFTTPVDPNKTREQIWARYKTWPHFGILNLPSANTLEKIETYQLSSDTNRASNLIVHSILVIWFRLTLDIEYLRHLETLEHILGLIMEHKTAKRRKRELPLEKKMAILHECVWLLDNKLLILPILHSNLKTHN